MTIREALPPIPPDIESGEGVVALPIRTDESKSDERMMFPVPFGVRDRFPFVVVPIVASDPPPRFSVVESIERVEAASIVARFEAFIVVRPDAERVVSDAAIVSVLSPESRVSVLVVEASVPAPTNVNDVWFRTVPSTDTNPASALSSIVIAPVAAETSNSSKLIAVAPPLIAVREVPLSVCVVLRFSVSVLSVTIDPDAPLIGERVIFPVVDPPIVSVLFCRD